MNFRELNIKLFKNEINHISDRLVEIKNNITSSYVIEKNDFITIDNYIDCIESYNEIVSILKNLQDRIIIRNKRR